MREIKFRAFYHWDKKMHYDVFANDEWTSETQPLNPVIQTIQDDKHWSDLMQYTGLKDKNGVEIYEGDIFEDGEDGSVNWVEYDADYAGFTTTDGKGSGWWNPKDLVDNVSYYEVIGNIYEAPELLNSETVPGEHSASQKASPGTPMNTVDTALPNWVCIPDEETSHLTTYKAGENGFGGCPDHEIAGGCSIPEEPFKALITSLTNEAELRGRQLEAKYWEYNIIPAVRNPQVTKDVEKRMAALLKLGASYRQPERSQDNLTPGREHSA